MLDAQIYVLRGANIVKVGRSVHPEQRKFGCSREIGEELDLTYSQRLGDQRMCNFTETNLHQVLARVFSVIRGREWYEPDARIEQIVQGLIPGVEALWEIDFKKRFSAMEVLVQGAEELLEKDNG